MVDDTTVRNLTLEIWAHTPAMSRPTMGLSIRSIFRLQLRAREEGATKPPLGRGYLPDLDNSDGSIIEVTQPLRGWWCHTYSIAGWGVVTLNGRYTTHLRAGTWGGTTSPRREEDYLHGYNLGGSMYPLHGGRPPTPRLLLRRRLTSSLRRWTVYLHDNEGRMFTSPPAT